LQFFRSPFFRNSQKSIEHKENQTKYSTRKMTRKPRSHVRILIHCTWAIAAALTCRPAQEPTVPWHSKHCLVHDSLHFYQMCAGETNQCFHFGIVVFVFLLKKKKAMKKVSRWGKLLRVWNPFPLKDKKMLKYNILLSFLRVNSQRHTEQKVGYLTFRTFSPYNVLAEINWHTTFNSLQKL